MVSTVDICNLALDELGEAAITALDEGSPVANLCSRNYAPARDQVLRSHPWNFAVARRRLARLAEVPAFGFAYGYQRPTDWLRTLSVHAGDGGRDAVPYRMEGDRLLSDAPDLFLRYIARVEDPNQYDALFVDALAMRLAARLTKAINQSTGEKERIEALYRDALRKARAVDGVEDFAEAVPDGSWLGVRG